MKMILLTITFVAALSLCGFAAETSAKSGKLLHVVALKFKAGTNAEQIQKVETAFRDLKKKIPQIATLEWGTNVSPEKHDKGFTHCFVQPIASQFASQYIEELAEKHFIYTAPIRRVTKSYTHCVAQTNAPALVCEFQFSRLTDIFVSSLNLPVHANQNTKV